MIRTRLPVASHIGIPMPNFLSHRLFMLFDQLFQRLSAVASRPEEVQGEAGGYGLEKSLFSLSLP